MILAVASGIILLLGLLSALAGSMSDAPGEGERWTRTGLVISMLGYTGVVIAITLRIVEVLQ